jgi:macrolide transport system ATP-binding/permease protein
MSSPHAPPRLAARLLEAVLPRTDRGSAILGDLHEEYLTRAERSRRRARLWYAREAVGIAVRYARRKDRDCSRGKLEPNHNQRGRWETFMESLVSNARYAVRRLVKNPMFTLVAIVSLGLGIGANTAIFSLVNAVIIRDLPFADPETLVDVYEGVEGFSHGTLSYPDYMDLVESSTDVFSAVGVVRMVMLQVDIDEGVETVFAEAVTGNYFSLLGVQPAVGRLISNADHVARGAHPVIVLGYDYWQSRYAGDPGVIGSPMRLGGRPYTIIGVAPKEFPGTLRGLAPALFIPVMMADELEGIGNDMTELRGSQSYFAKARLVPGATIAQAEAIADRLSSDLREEYPRYWGPTKRFVLEPTADVIMNPMIDRFVVSAAGMLMAVVGLVLLIACANLASFLLARAADRRREIAVRLAMGARRRALIGQLLTETVILSTLGGLAGIAVALQSLSALVAADLPLPFPITLDLSLDRVVLGFSIVVSVGAGLLFGLVPALQSTNPDIAPTLRDETSGGGRTRGAALRDALVVGQVAVSVVLLVGAGLFLRSLEASRNVDPGFGDAPAGIVQLTVPANRYNVAEGLVYQASLTERVAEIPGVEAVGLIDNLPLDQLNTQTIRVRVDGVQPPPGRDFHGVDYAVIDDGFLSAAGIPVVAGRGFDAREQPDTEEAALVNEEFVRRFFPGGDAVGRSITLNQDPVVVVGVTADHKVRQLGEQPRAMVYLSHRQTFSNYVSVVARTTVDDERLALEMMTVARALDPEIMIVGTKTMRRHLAIVLLGRELGAWVVGGFALLALLLASIGLYGVVSYAVARRAKEVGIRLSLGAESSSVIRMLTGSGMKLVGVGGAIGLAIAAAASQLVSRLLYGVPALDAMTFIAVPVVLALVALLAAWIPARRVTRIDPVGALRTE